MGHVIAAKATTTERAGGEKCVCGRWEDYAGLGGRWVAMDMGTNGDR